MRGDGRNRIVKAEGCCWRWHMTAKPTGTQPTVNVALVHRQFTFLPGEICLACGVDEVSDERPGRAVPEANQALSWVGWANLKRANLQPQLLIGTARLAVTCDVIGQKSAEVIVGSKELKDRPSQPHGGAAQTSKSR